MKALVTGSEGFIGHAFAEALWDRGYAVTDIDLVNGEDALEYFHESSVQYDLIVHAAYHVGGRVAIDGNNLLLADNLQLDGAMFNYALRTEAKRVLYFSSSAAYPVRLQDGVRAGRLREHDITLAGDARGDIGVPDAHYGWAKLTGERLAQQARLLGLNVQVVRPFSGYGEEQSMDYPFMSIVTRALEGDYSVWGPPEQTRDWIHIDDILDACFALMKHDVQVPVNLCTGRGVRMGDLLKMAYSIATGRELIHEIEYQLDKPTGVIHRVGDPSRLHKYFEPSVSLEDGILRALAHL